MNCVRISTTKGTRKEVRKMKDLHWEEVSIKERKAVYEVYAECLLKKEGVKLTWEQADACWTGSRWITIKYTFGIK